MRCEDLSADARAGPQVGWRDDSVVVTAGGAVDNSGNRHRNGTGVGPEYFGFDAELGKYGGQRAPFDVLRSDGVGSPWGWIRAGHEG